MKIKSVTVLAPDRQQLNIQYTKAIARIIKRRLPPEQLGLFLEILEEVE